MDESFSRRVELLQAALDMVPAERDGFLQRECAEDTELLAAVRALLAIDDREWDLLDRPVDAIAASVFKQGEDEGDHDDYSHHGGECIGAWRLIRELGRGGMGSVWLAERADGQFEQHVALKLIKPGMDSAYVQAQFRRERDVLARLQHPNIAQLIDGGADDQGRLWFAMELIEGVGLRRWIDSAPSLHTRLALFVKLCGAIAHAHQQLVVHRDLKPSNVMVQADNEPRLLDFGIAKLLEEGSDATQTVQRFATRAYAAPEQVRGEAVSTVTDVYALGIVLFELLTGAHFSELRAEKAPITRPSHVVRRSTSPLNAIPSGLLRGDLDAITMRALAEEPGRRYPGADALADDVRRFLRGQPVTARPDSVRYRTLKFLRRHAAVSVAAAAAVLALLVGLGVSLHQTQRAREAQQQAELQTRRMLATQQALQQVFEAADPRNNNGQPLSAHGLLEIGSSGIIDSLQDVPELQVDLSGLLGRLYFAIGDLESAERHFLFALEWTLTHPDQRVMRIIALRDAAGLRHVRGDPREGLAWIEQALELDGDARNSHEFHDELLQTKVNLLRQLGDYAKALPIQRDLLERAEQRHGSDDPAVADAATALAMLYEHMGEVAAAEKLLRRVLAIRIATLGPDHLDTAIARSTLAEWLQQNGDLRECESLQRESLAVFRKVLPAQHALTAQALNSLGLILTREGRYESAEPYLREAVTMSATPGVAGIGLRASALNNLALNQYYRNDLANATLHFRKAHQLLVEMYGPDNAETLRAQAALGAAFLAQGHFEDAERELRDSLQRRAAHYGTSDAVYLNTLNLLGRTLLESGRANEAVATLEDAHAIEARTSGGGMSDLQALTELFLAQALLGNGEIEASERFAKRALKAFQELYPDGHPNVARAQVALADTQLALGAIAEARELAAAAVEMRTSAFGDEDWRSAEAQVLLHISECRLQPDPERRRAAQAAIENLAALQAWHPRLAAWRADSC